MAEVALAILPLIVSGTKNYKYITRPAALLTNRPRKEAKRLKQVLTVAMMRYINCCENLLYLVTNEGSSMINDTANPLWKDEGIETLIKERLDLKSSAFMAAMELINNILDKIVQEIKTNSAALDQRVGCKIVVVVEVIDIIDSTNPFVLILNPFDDWETEPKSLSSGAKFANDYVT